MILLLQCSAAIFSLQCSCLTPGLLARHFACHHSPLAGTSTVAYSAVHLIPHPMSYCTRLFKDPYFMAPCLSNNVPSFYSVLDLFPDTARLPAFPDSICPDFGLSTMLTECRLPLLDDAVCLFFLYYAWIHQLVLMKAT